MLDCLIGKSSFLAGIVTSTFRIRHTGHKCVKERVTDEPHTIIEDFHPSSVDPSWIRNLLYPFNPIISVKDNIQISIDSFHHSVLSEGTPAATCKVCKEDTETLRESWFCFLPEILFIHLNRFNVDGKTIRKILDWVNYESEINVPLILDPEVMVPTPCPYTLQAVIYHSGSFGKGHYTAHVRYRGSTNWILCNDNAVCVLNEPKAKKKPIDPKTPYLFVYSRLLCKSMPLTLIIKKIWSLHHQTVCKGVSPFHGLWLPCRA